MRAIWLGCVVLIVLLSGLVLADDHVVLIDEDVDFSAFRTFTIGTVTVTSKHPALNSPVVPRVLREAANAVLMNRGLAPVASQPALIVDSSVRSVDYGIDRMGRPVEQGVSRGRGRRQPNPNQPDFTEGTLVIDVIRADTKALVWRGVYHDTDPDASRVAAALPEHVKTLLSRFPRLRK
jgi:hypothetical protein